MLHKVLFQWRGMRLGGAGWTKEPRREGMGKRRREKTLPARPICASCVYHCGVSNSNAATSLDRETGSKNLLAGRGLNGLEVYRFFGEGEGIGAAMRENKMEWSPFNLNTSDALTPPIHCICNDMKDNSRMNKKICRRLLYRNCSNFTFWTKFVSHRCRKEFQSGPTFDLPLDAYILYLRRKENILI